MITTTPIFKAIYGNQWEKLPPVLLKHYANRPYTNDVVTVKGILKVELSWFARLIAPILRITGSLIPISGENINVTVHFRSEMNSNAYCFDRILHFPGRKTYRFFSRIVPIGEDEAIEFMPVGIGWHARHYYDGEKTVMAHRGYKIKLFNKYLRIPLEPLFGKGYAEERPTDDNSFCMYMDIRHFLFGKIYSYSGEFTLESINLDS